MGSNAIRRRIAAVALYSAALLTAGQASASDSSRDLAAGGLVFTPDPSIAVDSLTVLIGPQDVTSTLLLRNTSNQAKRLQFGFPLPDLDLALHSETEISLPSPADPVNFVGSALRVAGETVKLSFEQRATALGLDVTADIIDAGLSLFPLSPETSTRSRRLEPSTRENFLERGILRTDDDRLVPAWLLKTTAFVRRPLDPASTTEISLRYKPVAGMTHLSAENLADFRRSACLDAASDAAIARKLKAAPQAVTANKVSYSLTTMIPWPGAIPNFLIEIVKPVPGTVVATCNKGFKIAGPTTLVFSATDYQPDEDISVYFIH